MPQRRQLHDCQKPERFRRTRIRLGQMLGPQTKMLDLCPREGRRNQASQQQKTGLSTTKQTVFSVEIFDATVPGMHCF